MALSPPDHASRPLLSSGTSFTAILAHKKCTLALDANDTNQRVVQSRLFSLMFGKKIIPLWILQ
jgi:hypothetical protein